MNDICLINKIFIKIILLKIVGVISFIVKLSLVLYLLWDIEVLSKFVFIINDCLDC